MDVWQQAILESVGSLGGEAGLQEIYAELPRHIQLTKEHLAPTKYGGRPAYQH